MKVRRLRAPSTDGGLLIEPPASAVSERVNANQERLSGWVHDFQGRPVDWLRKLVRREVTTLALAYLDDHGISRSSDDIDLLCSVGRPMVVTGHQPELFHPGVWVKNFAVAGIAQERNGVGLNLIVDNDIPKEPSIRVPSGKLGELRSTRIDFDRWETEIPFEDLYIHDTSLWSSFPGRVRNALGTTIEDPILHEFWARVTRRDRARAPIGERFALARREIEASWGISNLEVPLSQVCQTDGFFWFVSHILAQLPRYQKVYNEALLEHRLAHGIRSRNHPVPGLTQKDEWLEAPFWVWRKERPRRRALLVRQRSRVMDLRIDGENDAMLELPLSPDAEGCCAVERLRDLAPRSIRLRTRALTTTMFSRFLLGDYFIHGIGGAKYDELGDVISRRFFGIEPPDYLALSMTAWLGLAKDETTSDDLRAIDRQLRGLKFNPDRAIGEPSSEEIRILIEAKREAIARHANSRKERLARCRSIRLLNDRLQPSILNVRDELTVARQGILKRLISNRVARSREYAFVLYSAQRLRKVLTAFAGTKWG